MFTVVINTFEISHRKSFEKKIHKSKLHCYHFNSGADINARNNLHQSLLHGAVLTSDIHMLTILLQSSIDMTLRDINGRTALDIACVKNCMGIISIIINKMKRGLDPSTLNELLYTSMIEAVVHDNSEVLQLLVDFGENKFNPRHRFVC